MMLIVNTFGRVRTQKGFSNQELFKLSCSENQRQVSSRIFQYSPDRTPDNMVSVFVGMAVALNL